MKVNNFLDGRIHLSDPLCIHGLGIIPMVAEKESLLPPMDLLEDALLNGTVRITETSESGEVPFLKLESNGLNPLLILEGEELVGGKQNRIVNTSIVILASTVIKIPVSCMEAGRWASRREDFASGDAVFPAKSRARQKESVSYNLVREGKFRSDRGRVWDEVSLCLHQMSVNSPTADFRVARQKATQQIESFVEAFQPVTGQVGAVFVSKDGILGLELLGSSELFGRCSKKIIRSFAFDVLSDSTLPSVQTDAAAVWWEKIRGAAVTRHSSPGTGDDLRVMANDLIGSGLVWEDVMVHFSCFPGDESVRQSREPMSRRTSASERRRRMLNQ
jgi:hypothetical protein